jgi:glutamate-1-semialdehyde 2,1-aminomutase
VTSAQSGIGRGDPGRRTTGSGEASSAISDLERQWLGAFRERTRFSDVANTQSARNIAQTQRERFSSGLPYPIYVGSGRGAYFDDLDGNRYLDLTAGWNAAILGRGNPRVAEAVAEAMAELGAPGGAMHPSVRRDQLADQVIERTPGAERLVFAPSGSEANAYAIRLARAFTGNELILRMEGGYHGQYDYLVGGQMPRAGLPASAARGVITVPFNDIERCQAQLRRYAGRLCAVIVEPMMTIPGAVQQRDGFLQELRRAAARAGVPFILDEVITGFRFAVGGASDYYAITPPPDMTVLGKMLGGGLPVAAVAGRAAILEQTISVSNTHAQNDVCIAAALAALEQVDRDSYSRVCDLGRRMRSGLEAVAMRTRTALQVTGDGPCCGLHFAQEEVCDYRSAGRANQGLWRLMCLGMANQGFSMSSRTFGPIVPFTESDVDRCLGAFEETIAAIDTAAEAG